MLRHMAASRNQANAKFQIYCSLHELRAQRELCAGLCCSIPACCRPCRTLTTSVWVAERQHTERAEECLCEAATCGWKLHAWLLMSFLPHRCTLNKDVHTQANARVSLWLFYPRFVGFVHFEVTHEHISVSCTYSTTSRMWAFKECQQDVSSTLLIS